MSASVEQLRTWATKAVGGKTDIERRLATTLLLNSAIRLLAQLNHERNARGLHIAGEVRQ